MKILVLNPQVDAERKIAQLFQARGVVTLACRTADEAMNLLASQSNEIAIALIHREGPGGDPGVKLLTRIRKDQTTKDIPVVLTTEKWSDEECMTHQETALAANATLRVPYSDDRLVNILEAVMGKKLGASMTREARDDISLTSLQRPGATAVSLVLEDATSLFSAAPAGPKTFELQLDAPGLVDGPPKTEEPSVGENDKTVASIQTHSPEAETDLGALFASAELEEPAQGGTPVVFPGQAPAPVELPTPEVATSAKPEIIFQTQAPSSEAYPIPEPEPIPAPAHDPHVDPHVAQELPYLFESAHGNGSAASREAAVAFSMPVGDSIVPGGAAHSPDTETLKKYLLLREQDVAVLSTQLKTARDQIGSLEDSLRIEKGRGTELSHIVGEQKKKIDDFERDKAHALEALQSEMGEIKFEAKSKGDKIRVLESKVRESTEEIEHLKERVRLDIRKIRVREKELENRLEIMKKDSEALIGAREGKIIELKRKLDLLEFNMDLLQNQYAREKENSGKLRDRLAKAAQVVRVAGGLLLDSKGSVSSNAAHEAAALEAESLTHDQDKAS